MADNLLSAKHHRAVFFFQPDCGKQDKEMGKITRHPAAVKTASPKGEDTEVFSNAAETPRSDRAVEMRVKLRSGAYRVDTRRLADKLLLRR